MNYLAPTGALITVTDFPPHTLTVAFGGNGVQLTSTGVAAAQSQVTTYLSAAKTAAINNQAGRFGRGVDSTVVGATSVQHPVLAADVAAQVAAWQVLIATAGNVNA